MTDLPRVSVLLVTKNGERYLDEVLDRIGQQRGCFQLDEIIAVDSGSRDRTLAILEAHAVRVIRIPAQEFGHGTTRNLAASHAQGDYLVFLTQDATPANADWLENLLAPVVAEPLVVGAYSRHTPRPSCHPMEWRRIVQEELSGRLDSRVNSRVDNPDYDRNPAFFYFFANTSSVVRRCTWYDIPGPRSSLARISCGPNASSKPAIKPPIAPTRSCITRMLTDRGPISGVTLSMSPPCTRRRASRRPAAWPSVCRQPSGRPAPTWPSGLGSGGRLRRASWVAGRCPR